MAEDAYQLGLENRRRLTGNAFRNGSTEREITETFPHLCVYAGVPAAATAFRVARTVLRPGAVG